MIPVNLLIDAFKELTDWLGLTSYAAEENARTMEKANEKAFKSSEKRVAAISDSYDIEIAKAKAAGKDTTQLELDKSKAVSDAAKKRLTDARSEYANLKGLSDKDSIERRKALRKRIEEENKLIKDGSKERQMIQIADDAEQKAKDDKAAEEAKARAVEAAKKYKEGKAAIQAEINAANKLVLDSNKTQEQKEIDDVKAKYAKLIAEAKKYKQDVSALTAAQDLEINNIRKEGANEFVKLETKKASDVSQLLVDTRTKSLQIQGEANMKAFEDQQAADKKAIEAAAAVEEQRRAIQQQGLEVASQGIKLIAGLFEKSKGVQKAAVIAESAIGIAKMIIANKTANVGALATPQAIATSGAAAAPVIALNNISTAIGIAGNIAATAKALQALGGGAAPAPPSVGGGGGTAGGSSVPSFVPGNLFGQGNAANNVGAPNGMDGSQNFTVTAVVSETEMTATQSKVNKIMKNSVL
jgi:hypothetical protein